MPDILLVNPRYKIMEEPMQEHLGFGYIASFLRRRGYSVEIIDAGLRRLSPKKLAGEIFALDPDLLGITIVYQAAAAEQLSVIPLLREAGFDSHITIGGYSATLAHREYIEWRDDVDSIVRGEGEYTTLELLEHLAGKREVGSIKGLTYRENGRIVENDVRPLIDDLDALPFPARDELHHAFERGGCVTIVSSRGCYAGCRYCSIRSFYDCLPGPNWRGRSPDNVLEELELVVRDTGCRKVKFEDANFFGPGEKGSDRVVRIAEGILERDLELSFRFECRTENVDEEVFTLLKRAGLEEVFIGVESFVPRVLDEMKKGATVEDNLRALDILAGLGIRAGVGFIAFDPDTTLEEFFTNLEMVKKHVFPYRKKLGFYIDPFGRLQVFAGTEIHRDLVRDGVVADDLFSDEFAFRDRATQIFYSVIQPIKSTVYGTKSWLKRHRIMKRREF